jgi:hypothetical protein
MPSRSVVQCDKDALESAGIVKIDVALRAWLAREGLWSSRALRRGEDGALAVTAGLFVVRQSPPTANGHTFLTLGGRARADRRHSATAGRLRQPVCSAAPLAIHLEQVVWPGLDPRIWPAHAQRCLMRLLLAIDQAAGIRRKLAGRAVAGKRRALKEVAG